MTSGPLGLRRRVWRASGILAGVAAAALVLSGCGPTAPVERRTSTSAPPVSRPTPSVTDMQPPNAVAIPGVNAWDGYHADQARTGDVAAGLAAPATVAWTANLGGAVYGQPVVWGGKVVAATETNRIVALDPANGQVMWSATVGSPLTDVGAVAGCGDIDPLGITSTPAIDTRSGTVFVVGEVSSGNGDVHHQLEGLSVATGQMILSEPVDPPLPAGESPLNLLQRASLAIANGRVYISYGGNDGDCGTYHGWVVGVEESGPPNLVSFEAAPDGQGGAIWQSGGAPAIDPSGNLYVGTGNANPGPPGSGPDLKKFAESIVKLSPALQPIATFKDQAAGGDEDLGTGNPVLVRGGSLFAVGKTDIGYVLSEAGLAQEAAIHGICGSDPDGGPAYDAAANRIFVPCRDGGIQSVDLSTDTVGPLMGGANASPTIAGGTLWAAQYPDGTITAFNEQTGAVVQTIGLGSAVPNFATPSVALGLLLVGTSEGVVAIR